MTTTKEKVFVTGGTGYIGQCLIRALLRDKKEVHALCRRDTRFPLQDSDGLHVHYGDILEAETVERAMKGCNTAYHLAAYCGICVDRTNRYYDINVLGTNNLLGAACINRLKRVVITSTIGTVGPSRNGPVNESSKRQYEFFTGYEHSKYVADKLASLYQSNTLDVVFVYPTSVFGPGVGTDSNVVTRLIRLFCLGKWRFIWGDGSNIGNYAFIDDVVRGHILAMERGVGGEKYFLGGVNMSWKRFFNILGEVIGKQEKLIRLPEKVIMFFARLEKIRAAITKHKPRITPEWAMKGFLNWPCSSKKAEYSIGYTITPIKEALKLTTDWIQ